MKTLEAFLNKVIGPIATKMNNSAFFGALTEAFMRLTPLTLGTAFILIVGNFPSPAFIKVQGAMLTWIEFLTAKGLASHFDAAVGAVTGIISLFVTYNFAYYYAIRKGKNGNTAGLMAITAFVLLMPQMVGYENLIHDAAIIGQEAHDAVSGGLAQIASSGAMKSVRAFQDTFVGGSGLFVGIFTSFIVAKMYVFLDDKNVRVKLPSSVPTNVAESLSPSILAGIIFVTFFVIRLIFSYFDTNIFAVIFELIQLPLQGIAGSPLFMIVVFTFTNLLWFFGIHPNLMMGAITPILFGVIVANKTAFASGLPIPYLSTSVVGSFVAAGFGGQGHTYGLVVSMFTAKSERYKSLRKLALVPSLFNINEPLIFGMPIMLNATFFIPMILSPIVLGFAGWFMMETLNFTSFNPLIALPWTTAAPIAMALQGGLTFFLMFLVAFGLNIIIWFPFFKIADNEAYQIEQNELKIKAK